MNSTGTGIVVVICTFGAALLGIFLRSRLPPDHLDGDSKDVVKLVMGLVATMAALVLSLLISTAHTTYDAQGGEIEKLGVNVFELDRTLARFGPQAEEARSLLRSLVAHDIARTWPKKGSQGMAYASAQLIAEGDHLFTAVAALPTSTPLEQLGKSHAFTLLNSIGETRRLMTVQARASLSRFVLSVLVCWLALLFFGFGLFARFNTTVIAALVAGAVSVATACVLILEMSQPYSGWMTISGAPLVEALQQIQPR
jgi:hypothetical protein